VIDPNTSIEELVRIGGQYVCVSLGLTVYFREPMQSFPHTVRTLLDAYLQRAEPHLTWYADTVTERFKKATPDLLRLPSQLLADPKSATKFVSWVYRGGREHADLTPWFVNAESAAHKTATRLSFISLSFPVEHWANDFPGFVAWVQRVLEPLPVFHGYAGFAYGQGENGGPPQYTMGIIHSLAMRFHGVEVDDPSLSDRSCYRRFKGVNWLTMVSEPLLDPLGGINMVTGDLERAGGITVHRMPWGLLIQAGDKPGIGDVNADPKPLPLYRKVNKVLRPIRVTSHFPFDGMRFEVPDTLKWLRRFDDVDEET